MCNAKKHYPQCRCGFGPPYAFWGVMKFEEKKSWMESVLGSMKELRKGLQELGYEREEVSEILEGFGDGQLKKRDSQIWLTQILSRVQYIQKESVTEGVPVPLFMLHLPEFSKGEKVKKSRIIFKENGGKEINWKIKALGSGMGGSQLLKLSSSAQAIAEKEQCKLLFVKIPIRVTRIVVRDNGEDVRSFLKAEVVGNSPNLNFRHGMKICKKKKCREDYVAMGVPIAFFPLSDTEPRTITRYTEEWDYGNKREVRIKLKAFGLQTIIKILIYREKKLNLTIELPGGHDYLLVSPQKPGGINWELDAGVAQGVLDNINMG